MKTRMADDLPDRVGAVEQKLDAVASSLDARFDQVDRRFEQVDQRFDQVDRRFEQVDRRFEQVDRRFEQVDRRFSEVDRRFDEVTAALVEQRQYTEFAFDRLRTEMIQRFEAMAAVMATRVQLTAVEDRVVTIEGKVDRIGRKLDQFIDSVTLVLPPRGCSPRPKKR